MKTYITFGQVHVHSVDGNTLDKDCVAVITAADLEECRNIAMELFEGKFHQTLATPPDMSYFPRGLIKI